MDIAQAARGRLLHSRQDAAASSVPGQQTPTYLQGIDSLMCQLLVTEQLQARHSAALFLSIRLLLLLLQDLLVLLVGWELLRAAQAACLMDLHAGKGFWLAAAACPAQGTTSGCSCR